MQANRPSDTALLIARAVAFMALDPAAGQLVPPRAAQASHWFLRASLPNADRLLRLLHHRWFRVLVRVAEWLTIPGILLHYIVRKKFLEEITRRQIENGAAQVVVLGAGFDTLAWRLHKEYGEVAFLEIDHPATQQFKQQALAGKNEVGSNLHFIPLDLSRSSPGDGLRECHYYNPAVRTHYVAEGLLMYLTEQCVRYIFTSIAGQSCFDSTVSFTYLEPQGNGAVDFKVQSILVRQWLRLRREPFRWGIKSAAVPSFLSQFDFDLVEIASSTTLREQYLTSAELRNRYLAEGEFIATARLTAT